MKISCPHCGTEYEIEKKDMYRYTTCPSCGKGFVAGASSSLQSDTAESAAAPQSSRVALPPRFARPAKDSPQGSPKSPKRRSVLRTVLLILGIVLCVLVLSGVAAFGGYQYFGEKPRLARGVANYESGSYDRAYGLLLPLAKKGYAQAQYLVGECLFAGKGVMKNVEDAARWSREAADQGVADAQYRMYRCYRDGVGVEKNSVNAVKWCRKAAEAQLEDAMFDMGMSYVDGTGVDKNEKSAFRWFRKGAECGYIMCQYKYGLCYKIGYGVEKDEDEAAKWQDKVVKTLRERANAGGAKAMLRLARLYKEGDFIDQDKEEAVIWFRKAAELGDVEAQGELALCYHKGEGVEEDQELSAKWMLKAALGGSKAADQWIMGRYYQEGWGVEQNSAEAVKWFVRAAEQGLPLAKYYLAMCYMEGDGVEKDEAKGMSLLEEAEKDGCEDAKKELARIHEEEEEQRRMEATARRVKEQSIANLEKAEGEIEEYKEKINAILRGKLTGDWLGFDAAKISLIDSSLSVAEEPALKAKAGSFGAASSQDDIDRTLAAAYKEQDRLKERFGEFVRVRKIYEERELESRKEKCSTCESSGLMACSRCDGSGEVVIRNSVPCPVCRYSDNPGRVKQEVQCPNCHGKNLVRFKCSACKGKGTRRYSLGGAHLDKFDKCDACGGSGWGELQDCPKCSGYGKLTLWQACSRCRGRATVPSGTKEECSTCEGKGKIKCERCEGKGFWYRPKQ